MTERLSLTSLKQRTREAGNNALGKLVDSKTITGLAAIAAAAGVIGGFNDTWPEILTGINYIQAQVGTQDLNGYDAAWRLLTQGDDQTVDAARRFVLHTGKSPVQSLQTWGDLAKVGLQMPQGVKPEDYALNSKLIGDYFTGHMFGGLRGMLLSITGIVTLIVAQKTLLGRKGPESEYSPEYAQVQRRYDLVDEDMVQQVEALLKTQRDKETYQMEQTYFQPKWCNLVMALLFRGNDRKQRKQALASIGLNRDDEIQEGEFRLVTKDGNPSIVIRVKRGGQDNFGKETYYADQGYPDLLARALSLLVGHTDVTTVKRRTELSREVFYTDPKTGKKGTTVAILNYDQYQDPSNPTDVCHRRVELVIPALAGVTPEEVFPEFFEILRHSKESAHSDRQIGYKISQVKI